MEIHKTKDYDIFNKTSNRPLNFSHVHKLTEEYKRNPKSFESSPIVVSKNMSIVDGQHRLETAKILGRPIFYIIDKNIVTEQQIYEEMMRRNMAQKSWKISDFIIFFADRGKSEYTFIKDLMNKYGDLFSISSIYCILKFDYKGLKNENRYTHILRNGRAVIINKEEVVEFLKSMANELSKKDIPSNFKRYFRCSKYLKALYFLYFNPKKGVKFDIFMKKMPEFCNYLRNASTETEAYECISYICRSHKNQK